MHEPRVTCRIYYTSVKRLFLNRTNLNDVQIIQTINETNEYEWVDFYAADTCFTCESGYTHYDKSCYNDYPSTTSDAFMDEFFEMGNVPRDLLSDTEVANIESAVTSQIAVEGASSQVLYAPTKDVGAVPPVVPEPSSSAAGRKRHRLLRRRLLQTRALLLVIRFTVPVDSLSTASKNLGAAFGSGELLTAVRTALGNEYTDTTVRSKASKQGYRAEDGAATSTVAAGRISNQLVTPEEDPCNTNNGGCHGLVSCTADPSNPFTGVMCGPCPGGYVGDGVVSGVGCSDVDECKADNLVNGGCSPLVVCSNTVGGRTCGACPAGYQGDGVTCADVDECLQANGGCDTLTACTNTEGGQTCGACPAGYKGSGETGCKKESACANNNGGCDPLTKCGDTATGGSSCGPCPAGYVGDGTEGCVDYDACAETPCAAGVHCEDDKAPLMTRKCGSCPPGQQGDGVTCKSNPCFLKNGGCDALTTCSQTVGYARPRGHSWSPVFIHSFVYLDNNAQL